MFRRCNATISVAMVIGFVTAITRGEVITCSGTGTAGDTELCFPTSGSLVIFGSGYFMEHFSSDPEHRSFDTTWNFEEIQCDDFNLRASVLNRVQTQVYVQGGALDNQVLCLLPQINERILSVRMQGSLSCAGSNCGMSNTCNQWSLSTTITIITDDRPCLTNNDEICNNVNDCNQNGYRDTCEPDCDNDGIPNGCDSNGCPGPIGPDDADFDLNCTIDVFDLFELLAHWGDCPPLPQPCPWDLNGDATINVFDLFVLFNAWGPHADGPLCSLE